MSALEKVKATDWAKETAAVGPPGPERTRDRLVVSKKRKAEGRTQKADKRLLEFGNEDRADPQTRKYLDAVTPRLVRGYAP